MVNSDYDEFNYQEFDSVYYGKKKITMEYEFGDTLDICSTHRCKIDNKKVNDPEFMSYSICEGKIKLKKGKE